MPVTPEGNSRPFNSLEKSQITEYAQELIRKGGLSDAEIADKAGKRFGLRSDERIGIIGIVRRSHASVETAAAMESNPSQAPNANAVPNIPTAEAADRGMFIHDLLIIYTDQTTGQKFYSREMWVTDTPQSVDAALAHARETAGENVPQRRSSWNKSGGYQSEYDISVQILDVGRGI